MEEQRIKVAVASLGGLKLGRGAGQSSILTFFDCTNINCPCDAIKA